MFIKDSVIKENKKYYPEILLKECKYEIKKRLKYEIKKRLKWKILLMMI